MTISSIKQLPLDENAIKAVYTDILDIPVLRGRLWNITSAEVIEDIWRKIVDKVNARDPFYDVKFSQNEKIMALYPITWKNGERSRRPAKNSRKTGHSGELNGSYDGRTNHIS